MALGQEGSEKTPWAEATGKGSAGKLPTKRGPGRFTRFLFDTIRKREREREKERALEKVTPQIFLSGQGTI